MGDAVHALRQQHPRHDYPDGHQDEHNPGPAQGNPGVGFILIGAGRSAAVHEPHSRQVGRQDGQGRQTDLPDLRFVLKDGENHRQDTEPGRQQYQVALLRRYPLQKPLAAKHQRHHRQYEDIEHI